MNYFAFFKANWRIVSFAISLTLFSGFGQTFVLSLYIPEIIKDFQISASKFSAIYAIATLCSGLTIMFSGKLIDRMRLWNFTFWAIAGFIAAHMVAGIAGNIFMLFLAFFMLRYFGQGLFSHIAMTSMGRYFSHARGKALSLAFLGYPLAETLIPVSVVLIISSIGWRESFLLSGATILIAFIPLTLYLLHNFDKSKIVEVPSQKTQSTVPRHMNKEWTHKEILSNFNFYLFAPTVFIVGFSVTALFFFQTFIAEFKGWSLTWMAFSIIAYAIGSLVFSIATGPLIDRFSARAIYPFILIPMLIGILTLAISQHPVVAFLFWFLTGVTAGANPVTGNALYAETYGVKNLGNIRSIFTFVMVSSTAAGPLLYSFLMDNGLNFNQIHIWMSIAIAINITYVFYGFKRKKNRSTDQ